MYTAYLTEDHELLRTSARDFAKAVLAPIAAQVDESEQFPMEVVEQMAEMGFYGIKIPEEYGGLGLDTRSYVVIMEELAKKCATASLFVTSANSLSSAPILLFGTEEQKQALLPGLASGALRIAFGLTEPGAGSDAAAITTKAVKDGDHYILNGTKCFITAAPISQYTILFAKTSPELGVKGITAFLLDMSLPGVTCGKPEKKMGQRGVPVTDIILEDVRVPASAVLGQVDKGFISAMQTLNYGRIGVAAMSLGMAQEALDLAVEHVKVRVQFGKPLAKQQAIQFMLADAKTKLNAARLTVYDAAYRMDTGDKDATAAASMAKYLAAETAQEVINTALQLHGGYGYSREYPIERIYRDIRVNSIYEGSSQVQQMVIAGDLLK